MSQDYADGKLAGLDMAPTIRWYELNGQLFFSKLTELFQNPKKQLPYQLVNSNMLPLSQDEIAALIGLFPQNAIDRSILESIVGQSETWFHRDSRQEQPIPTNDISLALSPTASIPSYTDYAKWTEEKPSADVVLYRIDGSAASGNVRKIISVQGFLHEFGGHTIIAPAFNIPEYSLRLPNGRIVKGFNYLIEFAKMAEKHAPISHYASAYRGKNNKFESDSPSYNPLIAISEELSEVIAAHILGFAFCGEDLRGKNPFADRPEIKEFAENFLNAKLVK